MDKFLRGAGLKIGFFIILIMPWIVLAQSVEDVRIQGLRALEESTIREYIELKPGDDFSPEIISSDIKRIYQSGLVDDVKVDKEKVAGKPDAVIVTYIITERWMVGSVKFQGNKKISEDDLKPIVNIQEHSIFNPTLLSDAKDKIEKEYEKKGMFLTRVYPRVDEVKEGVVDIIFEIEEYKKPAVSKVSFYGNEKLKERELRKVMQTKQAWYLFTASKYDEDILSQDLYRLYGFCLDRGFLEAKIQAPVAYLDQDPERVSVSVFMEEGEQYRVAQIRIQGDLVAPEEELRKGLLLKEGEFYSESKVRRDIQYLSDFYSNLGYHLVSVDRDLRLDYRLRLVYVTYTISKGSKIYLDRIEVKGNEQTIDTVLRRELAVKEGYLYSDAQARRSQERLMRTGYFESVELFDRPGDAPDRMGLEIGVKEAKSGTLMAGAGYSSLEMFVFNLEYRQQNFLGRGWNFSAMLRSSTLAQDYSIQFDDPYFLDSDWHLGISAYSYKSILYYFDQERMGGSITGGRKIPHTEFSYFYLTYSYAISNLENFSESSQIYRLQPQDSPTSSMTFTFKRNALNNYLDPTKGTYFSSSLQYAGGLLGGENDFTKSVSQIQYYQPVPLPKLNHYVSFRGQFGYLWRPDDSDLLITERFFLGRTNGLRGYEAGAVSPVFIEDDGSESRIGGNKMMALSVDYIIPLADTGFKLALFYDIGNVYNDNEEIDFANTKQDWGVGLRWASPMGPLRFELGFPINPDKNDEPQVFNFGFGTGY